MTTICVRVEENVKKEASSLFSDLGLDLSTAINMFLRKAISSKGIPFEVKKEIPNQKTIEAINEIEQIKKGKIKAKRYSSTDDLFNDLNNE